MKMDIKVRRRGFSGRIALREKNRISREVLWLAGFVWHRDIRPKHFTHAGAAEYGYQPRSDRYQMRKLKAKGHTYPLVFSGDSQDATERTANIQSSATANRSRVAVRMRAPTLNYKNPRSRIDMRDELTRTSRRDEELLREVIQVNTLSRYRAMGASSVERIS